LYVSSEFLEKRDLSHGDMVVIEDGDKKLAIMTSLDTTISGDIAYLPTFDEKLDTRQFFEDGYRYANLHVKGVNNE